MTAVGEVPPATVRFIANSVHPEAPGAGVFGSVPGPAAGPPPAASPGGLGAGSGAFSLYPSH